MGLHIPQHHAAGAHLGAFPHLDIAQHLGAGGYQHAGADLGMTVTLLVAGAAEGHLLQDGYIVVDDAGLADDDAGGVVEHYAPAHHTGRMDVHAEHLGVAALDEQRQIPPPRRPQAVGQPVHLNRMIAFEVENHRQITADGRIPLLDRGQVAGRHFDYLRRLGKRLVEQLTHDGRRHHLVRQLVGEDETEAGFKAVVIQHAGIDITRQQRLLPDHLLRLVPQFLPKTVHHR